MLNKIHKIIILLSVIVTLWGVETAAQEVPAYDYDELDEVYNQYYNYQDTEENDSYYNYAAPMEGNGQYQPSIVGQNPNYYGNNDNIYDNDLYDYDTFDY